jgi:hypothetical protein
MTLISGTINFLVSSFSMLMSYRLQLFQLQPDFGAHSSWCFTTCRDKASNLVALRLAVARILLPWLFCEQESVSLPHYSLGATGLIHQCPVKSAISWYFQHNLLSAIPVYPTFSFFMFFIVGSWFRLQGKLVRYNRSALINKQRCYSCSQPE